MTNKDLKNSAHKHKGQDSFWWYETSKGIEVYFHVPGLPLIPHATIPWASIKAAVRRKDK